MRNWSGNVGDAREMVEVVVGVMKEEKTPVNFF